MSSVGQQAFATYSQRTENLKEWKNITQELTQRFKKTCENALQQDYNQILKFPIPSVGIMNSIAYPEIFFFSLACGSLEREGRAGAGILASAAFIRSILHYNQDNYSSSGLTDINELGFQDSLALLDLASLTNEEKENWAKINLPATPASVGILLRILKDSESVKRRLFPLSRAFTLDSTQTPIFNGYVNNQQSALSALINWASKRLAQAADSLTPEHLATLNEEILKIISAHANPSLRQMIGTELSDRAEKRDSLDLYYFLNRDLGLNVGATLTPWASALSFYNLSQYTSRSRLTEFGITSLVDPNRSTAVIVGEAVYLPPVIERGVPTIIPIISLSDWKTHQKTVEDALTVLEGYGIKNQNSVLIASDQKVPVKSFSTPILGDFLKMLSPLGFIQDNLLDPNRKKVIIFKHPSFNAVFLPVKDGEVRVISFEKYLEELNAARDAYIKAENNYDNHIGIAFIRAFEMLFDPLTGFTDEHSRLLYEMVKAIRRFNELGFHEEAKALEKHNNKLVNARIEDAKTNSLIALISTPFLVVGGWALLPQSAITSISALYTRKLVFTSVALGTGFSLARQTANICDGTRNSISGYQLAKDVLASLVLAPLLNPARPTLSRITLGSFTGLGVNSSKNQAAQGNTATAIVDFTGAAFGIFRLAQRPITNITPANRNIPSTLLTPSKLPPRNRCEDFGNTQLAAFVSKTSTFSTRGPSTSIGKVELPCNSPVLRPLARTNVTSIPEGGNRVTGFPYFPNPYSSLTQTSTQQQQPLSRLNIVAQTSNEPPIGMPDSRTGWEAVFDEESGKWIAYNSSDGDLYYEYIDGKWIRKSASGRWRWGWLTDLFKNGKFFLIATGAPATKPQVAIYIKQGTVKSLSDIPAALLSQIPLIELVTKDSKGQQVLSVENVQKIIEMAKNGKPVRVKHENELFLIAGIQLNERRSPEFLGEGMLTAVLSAIDLTGNGVEGALRLPKLATNLPVQENLKRVNAMETYLNAMKLLKEFNIPAVEILKSPAQKDWPYFVNESYLPWIFVSRYNTIISLHKYIAGGPSSLPPGISANEMEEALRIFSEQSAHVALLGELDLHGDNIVFVRNSEGVVEVRILDSGSFSFTEIDDFDPNSWDIGRHILLERAFNRIEYPEGSFDQTLHSKLADIVFKVTVAKRKELYGMNLNSALTQMNVAPIKIIQSTPSPSNAAPDPSFPLTPPQADFATNPSPILQPSSINKPGDGDGELTDFATKPSPIDRPSSINKPGDGELVETR